MWIRGISMRNYNLFVLILGIVLLSTHELRAQVPEWSESIPEGYMNDYYVSSAQSNSPSEAYQSAINTGLNTINISYNEVKISSVVEQRLESVTKSKDGGFTNISGSSRLNRKIILESTGKLPRGIKVVDFYINETQNKDFEAWVLLSKPKRNPESPPSAFSYVGSSIIIPGSGQIIKDQTVKGTVFLSTMLVSVSAYFAFDYLESDSQTKAMETNKQDIRSYYNDRAKTMSILKTGSLILAAAIYSWNVADAIYDEPSFYVIVTPPLDQQTRYATLSFNLRF